MFSEFYLIESTTKRVTLSTTYETTSTFPPFPGDVPVPTSYIITSTEGKNNNVTGMI